MEGTIVYMLSTKPASSAFAGDGHTSGSRLDALLGAVAPLLQPVHARATRAQLYLDALGVVPTPMAGSATVRHLQTLLGDAQVVGLLLLVVGMAPSSCR